MSGKKMRGFLPPQTETFPTLLLSWGMGTPTWKKMGMLVRKI